MQERRQWCEIFKVLKEKKNTRIAYLAKLSLKVKENKDFSDKNGMNSSLVDLVLQETLKQNCERKKW